MTKDWVHGVGHSPVCQILLQIVVRVVITFSPPAWTSPAGLLSTPADFPFFSDCAAASTPLRKMGWSSFVSVWGQFSTDGSQLVERTSCLQKHFTLRAGSPLFTHVDSLNVTAMAVASSSSLWSHPLFDGS